MYSLKMCVHILTTYNRGESIWFTLSPKCKGTGKWTINFFALFTESFWNHEKGITEAVSCCAGIFSSVYFTVCHINC